MVANRSTARAPSTVPRRAQLLGDEEREAQRTPVLPCVSIAATKATT